MNTHSNALLSAWTQQTLVTRVETGETQAANAAALGVNREMGNKCYRRLSQAPERAASASDRSSRPHHSTT